MEYFTTIEQNYEHFNQRLKERHGLEISFDEYKYFSNLWDHNSNVEIVYRLGTYISLYLITIKGKKIPVIKKNKRAKTKLFPLGKEACLITALDSNMESWPIPYNLKKFNINRIIFWKEVNITLDSAKILASKFSTVDKKVYFNDKPFGDYDKYIYNLGYALYKEHDIKLNHLTNYVYNKFMRKSSQE